MALFYEQNSPIFYCHAPHCSYWNFSRLMFNLSSFSKILVAINFYREVVKKIVNLCSQQLFFNSPPYARKYWNIQATLAYIHIILYLLNNNKNNNNTTLIKGRMSHGLTSSFAFISFAVVLCSILFAWYCGV